MVLTRPAALLALSLLAAGLNVHCSPVEPTATNSSISLSSKSAKPTGPWTGPPQTPAAVTPAPGSPGGSAPTATSTSRATDWTVPDSPGAAPGTADLPATTPVATPAASDRPGEGLTPAAPWTPTPVVPSSDPRGTSLQPSPGPPTPSDASSASSHPGPTSSSSSAPPFQEASPATSSTDQNTTGRDHEGRPERPSGGPTSGPQTAGEPTPPPTSPPPAPAWPKPEETSPPASVPPKMAREPEETERASAPPEVIMEEVRHALSSGSIAAITVTVIAVSLLVFGVATYLKIRHSSYGRLLDEHGSSSWGNYNNPLYDDS
ncbi:prostate androgen-regulated mucin-like protein 1 isoform X1 [Ornithorhynchus anatinus]|nr:prostate androgen-regulated mucin-like protein 1 isoform X1 [Ornithorhynchus anatinus]